MNERTHFFIKIYHSHFIQKGWCWLCVRGELETGTDCYILTLSSSDHSSTSSSFWLGYSTVGHWGPQTLCLQTDSHAGILSPTDSNCNWNWNSNLNWLNTSVAPGYIIVSRPPASCGRTHLPPSLIQSRPQVKVIFRYLRPDASISLFFRLFTKVHLLINGLVEGQYVTIMHRYKRRMSVIT